MTLFSRRAEPLATVVLPVALPRALSVAAISYYVLGLAAYPIKGAKDAAV